MSTIKAIRVNLFKATQAEFASLVGTTQASVSRWEHGVSPSLEDLLAIRRAAMDIGIEWNDALFFGQTAEAAE